MSTEHPSRRDLTVLNVVIATPEARGGAIRAGLKFGSSLADYVSVDTVKMRGDHDEALAEELGLPGPITQITSISLIPEALTRGFGSGKNYSNAMILTSLKPPKNLQSYDLVHLHNAVPLAGFVSVALRCRLTGVPYCVTTHGISKIPEFPQSMDMSLPAKWVFRLGFLRPYWWVLRNAVHLFALSETDAEVLRHRFPDQSISILPNGVEPNPPTEDVAETVENQFDIPPTVPLLLFVGKLLPSKGIDDLLDAYEQLENDARLVIVGPAADQRIVERIEMVKGADYLGYIDQHLLNALYQRADLFVFPTRSDVFPLVTLEAMASKTPVVTTEVGGLPEQVKTDAGVLVPTRSPNRLAREVDRLLDAPDLRESMGERAFERVQNHYSWESVAERAATEYERLCRKGSRVMSSTESE